MITEKNLIKYKFTIWQKQYATHLANKNNHIEIRDLMVKLGAKNTKFIYDIPNI